ncbi:transglycosylase SLT domain-containing protein [Shewanella submarina]|uniref:Transglycosylase SLT domain-containing protein n=1 Tax=Shewanella submarina TaxID=2016376 RepID=A0ABV7GD21_9GAMM|nr:transglycosylase SLT domain-containing protein [Shewanella submarina]MCL1039180.1 transglycosylase SLT domain-containing protein [Shewanella submarina]
MLKQLLGILGLVSFSMGLTTTSAAAGLTAQQQAYLDAREAQEQGNSARYQTLRKQLGDYPLTVYLDYHDKQDDILRQSGPKAAISLAAFAQTPLYNTLKHRYLQRAGKQKRWKDFLAISPKLPRDTELQCYYYRAKLQNGDPSLAWVGAKNLWLHGYSQPDACDVLFSEWTKAGKRSQDLVWQRMMLAFDSGQYSLMSWLSRKVTGHKQDAEALVQVYRDPRRLRHINRYMGSGEYKEDIVAAGLKRLARKDLEQAVRLYLKYQKADRFTEHESRKLNRYLVRRALIRQEESLSDHVDTMLPLLGSDDLTEMRLRWAIRNGDNQVIEKTLPLLSDTAAASARWQFWQARMMTDPARRSDSLAKLATQRNFYGFMAANSQGLPINLNQITPAEDQAAQQKLEKDAAWLRVVELQALDKHYDARVEWRQLLARVNQEARTQYTLMAGNNNWPAMGVQGTIQGKLWNHVSQRFPLAHEGEFNAAAKRHKVNGDELRAIARRESAFYPRARSGVGARGLMQLMPATAKETARKHKLKYRRQSDLYDVGLNVKLGSAYYAGLLQQFDQNRILATAAYNAGPHRVTAWLKRTDGKLDAVSFIESIPFRETREYVQAVFSYRLIYEELAGKATTPLLSDAEQSASY